MTDVLAAAPKRADVPKEQTWNAESVYPSRQEWYAAVAAIEAQIPSLARWQGHVADNATTVLEAQRAQEALSLEFTKLFVYANMSSSVDATDDEANAMSGQARALYGRVAAATSYIEPELLAAGEPQVRAWMSESPDLSIYAQYFDNLFRRQAHIRSAEVEEILGLAMDPLNSVANTEKVLTSADTHFAMATTAGGETIPVFQSNWQELLHNADRVVRRTTWEAYNDGYLAHKNTLASNLIVSYKRDVFQARARRYPSTLEASLFASNIPVQVYRTTIETYQKHVPLWHRYWDVVRRALGVLKLHGYDAHVSLSPNSPRVPFAQAAEWISNALAPLGEDYAAAIRKGCLEDRWVDWAPNQGKVEGAFSSGAPGISPFIMMSYTDSIQSMSTLAHELGHSMHSYLAWQKQPLVNARYSLFVAEVASNFHQAMTRASLFQMHPDRDFQLAVLDEAMRNFHRYFFIMPVLARFELEIHERTERGQSPTADTMNGLMAGFLAEAYGPAVEVDRERDGIMWAQFRHFYSAYYVYQYTTGISAANMLAQGVLSGDPAKAANYRAFLEAGASLYPIDALKLAGVDMTTPAAVEATFEVLAGFVDRLEQLTAK